MEVLKIVPSRSIGPETVAWFKGMESFWTMPRQPVLKLKAYQRYCLMAVLTLIRITAFNPGQSLTPVKIAICLLLTPASNSTKIS
ncbi:MAG TPA: hypothetical protein VIM29_04305 [Bacillota bacterium]